MVVVDVEMELTQGMKASRGRNVFTPSAGLTRCSVRSPQGGGNGAAPNVATHASISVIIVSRKS